MEKLAKKMREALEISIGIELAFAATGKAAVEDIIARHITAWAKGRDEQVRRGLQLIIKNDKTRYEHHEARPWDGKTPREVDGGTIFITPREKACGLLRALGGETT